ncbi:MAG: Ig-like domain-containing protein [bacterium]
MRLPIRILLLMGILFVLFCAKKMLPPSPDRFPPRLIEVKPKSRVQLELVFDEDIDPGRLVPESIQVAGLAIRGVSLGRQRSRILVWTEPQERKGYKVRGVVWDLAGNAGSFRSGFQGSFRVDTIAPRVISILPAPGSAGLSRALRIAVRFSEPVDTTLPLNYLIVPRDAESLFVRSWDFNWQEVRFVGRDSLPGREYYFLLWAGIEDLEGNRCGTPAWTYFSSDSVFEAVRVRGRASGAGPRGGVILFNREQTVALAPILSDGSFDLKLRSGDYTVFGVSDANGDGLIDMRSEAIKFNTGAESLLLFFARESLPKPIDEYLY